MLYSLPSALARGYSCSVVSSRLYVCRRGFCGLVPRRLATWYWFDQEAIEDPARARAVMVQGLYLASFPGAEKGEGEKERLVSTVCACALNSWKTSSGHLRYTNFCEVADFCCVEDAYHQPLSV